MTKKREPARKTGSNEIDTDDSSTLRPKFLSDCVKDFINDYSSRYRKFRIPNRDRHQVINDVAKYTSKFCRGLLLGLYRWKDCFSVTGTLAKFFKLLRKRLLKPTHVKTIERIAQHEEMMLAMGKLIHDAGLANSLQCLSKEEDYANEVV